MDTFSLIPTPLLMSLRLQSLAEVVVDQLGNVLAKSMMQYADKILFLIIIIIIMVIFKCYFSGELIALS